MIKRFSINLLIIFMIFIGVIYGYTQSLSLSKFDRFSVYAADNSTDRQDLIDSFTAYCKSRNLLVNGTVLGSAAEWTGTTLEQIISMLGIDMDYLQAQINKEVSSNFGVRYALTSTGIGLYNRIFAELLQREDLEVNDTDVEKKVYSGRIFTDIDGNKCLVYVLPKSSNWNNSSYKPVYYGSVYKYDYKQLIRLYESGYKNPVYRVSNTQTDSTVVYKTTDPYYDPIYGFYNLQAFTEQIYAKSKSGGRVDLTGSRIIGCLESDPNTLYFGSLNYMSRNDNPGFTDFPYYGWSLFWVINNSDSEPTDVDITTPDDEPIKPSLPDDKPINIYPTGDTDHDTGGGGGGGQDPDPDDPNPDPSSPDMPDWGTDTDIVPDGDGWKIPFSLPDLDIDWSLKDIGHKFPFCIPSDIVSFYRTLSVEPEAPSIDAHIPLGSFYDWHFEADFSQYDRWAVIIRAVEYVGFVIGLIYFTVRLVKG